MVECLYPRFGAWPDSLSSPVMEPAGSPWKASVQLTPLRVLSSRLASLLKRLDVCKTLRLIGSSTLPTRSPPLLSCLLDVVRNSTRKRRYSLARLTLSCVDRMYIWESWRFICNGRWKSVQVFEDELASSIVIVPAETSLVQQTHRLQKHIAAVTRMLFVQPLQRNDHIRVPDPAPKLFVSDVLSKHCVHKRNEMMQSRQDPQHRTRLCFHKLHEAQA